MTGKVMTREEVRAGPEGDELLSACHDPHYGAVEIGNLRATVRKHEAEIERLETEAENLMQGTFVDPGANPVVSWKSRAERTEAERDRLREMIKLSENFQMLACDNCGQWQYQDCSCGVGFQWLDAREAALTPTYNADAE